jgi:YkoY family integral membrane protein
VVRLRRARIAGIASAILNGWVDAIRWRTVLTFVPSDLLTVALLVGLEALLSADNALVMAIMVLGLPRREHKQALRYGLVGVFAFRILATLLAVYLIRLIWVKLAGGLYLAYLTYSHFAGGEEGTDRRTPPKAKPMLGLSPFWATVVRVELINLAFSIDSILVAVAMSPKTWVVVSGGILGILAMRFVVGKLLVLVERYPSLVDGAFIIIGWVAFKLIGEYADAAGFVDFEIPHWTSLIVIVLVLVVAYVWGRIKGPLPPHEDEPQVDEP